MSTPDFEVEGKTISFPNGTSVELAHPVKMAIGYGEVVVVLLDVLAKADCNENVFGVARTGKIAWQIPRRKHVYRSSPYTGLIRNQDFARVANWDGLVIDIDPSTGNIVGEHWTK